LLAVAAVNQASTRLEQQIASSKPQIWMPDENTYIKHSYIYTSSSGVENVNLFRNARGMVSSSTSKTLQKKNMTGQIIVF
jgi:hypothetical protein